MPDDTPGAGRPRSLLMLGVVALLIAAIAAFVTFNQSPHLVHHSGVASATTRSRGMVRVTDPIDPKYLTALPFGKSSFWIQPWRSYLDTWPASRLLSSLGANFQVSAAEAEPVARMLHQSGFTLARIAINWDSLSYAHPSRFIDATGIRTRLTALQRNRLRPLILLDANSAGPCPAKRITLKTTSFAPAGATTVRLSASSAAAVVPGKSGFDGSVFTKLDGAPPRHHRRGRRTPLSPQQRLERRAARHASAKAGFTRLTLEGNPAILIVKVSHGDVATLSRPLPGALPAGSYRGTTLLYAPFAAPTLADGSPDAAFQTTLKGWLQYVKTVATTAQGIFGPNGYDFEVWNELAFGSQFLNAQYYYSTAREASTHQITNEVTKALLSATVAFVRNPANGISPAVGITDGFASQTPFPSSAKAPLGLTALSKHLYTNVKRFPEDFRVGPGNVPVNALGERDTAGHGRSREDLTPLFIPHYQSLYPEFPLTGVQTATVVRDLSPLTTSIHHAPHGRYVAASHGKPLQVWMTEYNLNTAKATPVGPDEVTPATGPSAQLSTADKEHFQAKALLRSLVANISKGMTREYFFKAGPGPLDLISNNFFTALQAKPGTYPGQETGGETMTAFRNLLTQFQGPGPQGPTRQLKLTSIEQEGNHAQFEGNGTPAHPNLYDSEVLAVFPFQASPTRFVIPIYVMTRDLLTLYQPQAPPTDIHRFDLPNETFHITLSNLPETPNPPTITAYDPLLNQTTPTQLLNHTNNTATIQLQATDYPRILTINYNAHTFGRRSSQRSS